MEDFKAGLRGFGLLRLLRVHGFELDHRRGGHLGTRGKCQSAQGARGQKQTRKSFIPHHRRKSSAILKIANLAASSRTWAIAALPSGFPDQLECARTREIAGRTE